MANKWSVAFNGKGVAAADTGKRGTFELPPEGLYQAKVTELERTAANPSKRAGEYNTRLTIEITEPGVNLKPRYFWIPEPETETETEAAKKAAEYGKALWVAFALSAGASKKALDSAIELSMEDVIGKTIYVKLVHEESTNVKKDGTPFINCNVDGFVTKDEYLASKGASKAAAGVAGSAKPAGGSLGSIFSNNR
jgi:hypothetical protein